MGFNLGASNNTGKLNMNDFLGDETAVQNDEKEIPINLLVPWENQPFKMYSDFKMNELVESIRENGLLSRIIVSPAADGKYRIIAGHNRVEACRRAGFTAVPSIVKNVDENRAKLRRDSERKFTIEQANTLAYLKFFSESDIAEICGEKTPVPEADEERAEPAENSDPTEPKHNVKKPSKQITLQRKEVTQLIGDELSNEEISEYFCFCLQRRDILEEWHKMYTEGKTDGTNA